MLTKSQHDEIREKLSEIQEHTAWITEQLGKIECVQHLCGTCGFNKDSFCTKHDNDLAGYNDGCEEWYYDNIPF